MMAAVVGSAQAPMGAASHTGTDLTGFRREGTESSSTKHDVIDARRCDSATRLQRTTGDCIGRPAADDAQQTARASDAVPARSLRPTPCSCRKRRTSHRCGLAWYHLAWM
jgi:hypothetical protein